MKDFDATFVELLNFLPPAPLPTLPPARKCEVCGAPLGAYNPNNSCLPHTNRLRDEQEQEVVEEAIRPFLSDLYDLMDVQGRVEFLEYLVESELCHRDVAEGEKAALLARTIQASLMPETIVRAVCAEYRVTMEQIIAKNRSQAILPARQALMYLWRIDASLSSLEIGRRLRRDHSTVLYTVEKVGTDILKDQALQTRIGKIQMRYTKV